MTELKERDSFPAGSTPFSFLKLPGELRNEVYHQFSANVFDCTWEPPNWSDEWAIADICSLIQTNRTIRKEALPIMRKILQGDALPVSIRDNESTTARFANTFFDAAECQKLSFLGDDQPYTMPTEIIKYINTLSIEILDLPKVREVSIAIESDRRPRAPLKRDLKKAICGLMQKVWTTKETCDLVECAITFEVHERSYREMLCAQMRRDDPTEALLWWACRECQDAWAGFPTSCRFCNIVAACEDFWIFE